MFYFYGELHVSFKLRVTYSQNVTFISKSVQLYNLWISYLFLHLFITTRIYLWSPNCFICNTFIWVPQKSVKRQSLPQPN
jgi:hypothetical protein